MPDNDKTTPEPYGELGFLLAQVSFLKQRIVNTALKPLGITYMQFVILAGTLELGNKGDSVTQQDIARERRLNKAMVSNIVKHLIECDLMKRVEHPADGRSYMLSLTDEGRRKALAGKKIAYDVDRVFFAKIDRHRLRETLAVLLANEGGDHE